MTPDQLADMISRQYGGDTAIHIPLTPFELADLLEAADLSDLSDNGDTHTLAPGYDVQLVIDSDPDASLNDEDPETIGRFQWTPHRAGRPNSFDGAARILDRDFHHECWWQPPADLIKGQYASPDAVDTLAQWIRDRWEQGWMYVALELLGPLPETEGDWRYQTWNPERPTIGQWGVGGVDELTPGYLPTLIDDLSSDLQHDLRNMATRTQ